MLQEWERDYRLTGLLSIPLKIMEFIMLEHLIPFLLQRDISYKEKLVILLNELGIIVKVFICKF